MLPYWRLSAYYFFYFAFIGAFSPYFGLYLQALRFSAWDIGLVMSLMQVMRVVAPNLWGWLSDRTGARMPIVRLAAVAAFAGFLGLFLTRSFGGVAVSIGILAFFWGAALPLVEALTLSHLGRDAGRYGSVRLWGSIGFIVSVLAGGTLLDHFPIDALLWLVMLILLGIMAASLPIPEAPAQRREAGHARLRQVLGRPEVLKLLAACFAMSAAHGALYVFYSIHLVDHGYSKSVVGWMWTLGVVAEIAVFMAMPAVLRRFPLERILQFSFACAVVRFLMIGWGVELPLVLVFAQLLHGATFGAYHAAAVGAIGRLFSGPHQARGQAIYSSVSFGAGGMLGGLVSGHVWETVGAGWTFSMGSAFALLGLVLMLRTSSPLPARR
ncbi:MAG: MFS transporter [Betaproteobacteria bacterium]|nr:MFS transporter [Betaproteobacteria bacterium]